MLQASQVLFLEFLKNFQRIFNEFSGTTSVVTGKLSGGGLNTDHEIVEWRNHHGAEFTVI
jgi:hypothetical protein